MHERFPKQGRAHQAVDHGRGLIRINCNHGTAGNEKSRICTANSSLAVGVEHLALNAPHTKVAAEGLSDFSLECAAAAPVVQRRGQAITGIERDRVRSGAEPRAGSKPSDVRSEPPQIGDESLVWSKLDC